MRATVLKGQGDTWEAESRSAAELKEAATYFDRAAALCSAPEMKARSPSAQAGAAARQRPGSGVTVCQLGHPRGVGYPYALEVSTTCGFYPPKLFARRPRARKEMLLLCRHGETEANKEHIIQGQSESDLTATGRAQAAALGQELTRRIGGGGEGPPLALTVYSSDLRRARDTAQAAVDALVGAGVVPAGSLRLATDERLRERRLGALQGRTAKESRGRWPLLWRAFQSDDSGAAAPCSSEPGADENGGIESSDEVRRRAGAALAEIAAAHAGQRVVVVSHGGCIHSAIMAVCTNLSDVAHIGNCSITTLVPAGAGLPWACDGPDDAFLPKALGVAATNADVSRSCPNPSEVPKA